MVRGYHINPIDFSGLVLKPKTCTRIRVTSADMDTCFLYLSCKSPYMYVYHCIHIYDYLILFRIYLYMTIYLFDYR